MSVSRYAHFFMTFSQNLSSAFQQTAPSLSNFSELIDLNWIEDCLKTDRESIGQKKKTPRRACCMASYWTCIVPRPAHLVCCSAAAAGFWHG